ncbi:DMT family transporter [Neptunomonas antarctica]|uniref:Permease of the drug/metabolite transporter (DMT) superfamily n=1 Tax=Neptunomonas antarctica TaxID=619304 RepID=A0A1N7PBG3_9GAMM|nr:DMT family transporter [Neptunomonas antarctica]SIT07888.1 Permease of the drug/metabolite transporter (DMT) superfamily [Neptunomonas antarctica]
MQKHTIILALLSAALFGAATPASKWLLAGLTPFQLAGFLYLGAALAVAPAFFIKGTLSLPSISDKPNRLRLLGAVVFGGILGPVLLLFGLNLAEAGSVSLWLNLELAATAVIGVLFFRDHLSINGWMGVLAAMLAASLLSWSQGSASIAAGALVLLACICWGLDNHLTALIDGITPSQSTFWKGLIAGSVNLSIGIALDPLSLDTKTIVGALLVGALSYGASIVLYIRSAQGMGATRAQVIFSSAPFFGVALSVLYLGESISGTHLLAAVIFIVAITLLLRDTHSHTHVHEELSHNHAHRHDDGHHNHYHPDMPSSVRHTHHHEHSDLEHKHPHWPDLHHRHSHKDDDK